MNVEELEQIQAELDKEYKVEMRYELYRKLRQHIVDWAQSNYGDKMGMAAMSAVSGRWEDVMRDITRGRITHTQAIALLDEFKKCQLIGDTAYTAYDWRMKQIKGQCEKC